MSFLPIVARELRVTARRRSTYWIRFSAAALALLLGGWSFLFLFSMGGASMAGKMLFGSLTGLAWLYAVIGGIFKTADALSEEKREGTLGLLFLTDLKGYDIVLGKIVAASVNWFFGLIALFPILALALLMGGVAPGEFWREILALTNLLFYSLALGMFVSSFMRNERRTAGLTITLLVLLLWLPPKFSQEHQKATGAANPSTALVLPDVTRPLHYSDDYAFRRNPELYWGSLAVSHGIGWIYLLLASLIVPRTWQQSAGKISRLQENAEQLTYGKNPARRRRFRERALAINPFYWIAARARGQSVMLFFILFAVCFCFWLSYVLHPNSWNSEGEFLMAGLVLNTIVKVWLALAACRRFVEDRRSGALELILSTPLTEQEIIAGQWRALAKQFRGPIIFVFTVDCLLFIFGFETIGNGANKMKDQLLCVMMFSSGVIVFLVDVIAIGWLSMWRGMKARHSYGAWLWTAVQLLVGPWLLFYIGVTAFMMLVFVPRFIGNGAMATGLTTMPKWMDWMSHICVALWFVISLASAILSIWWSRRCLQKYFRYQATLSYQPVKASSPSRAISTKLPPRLNES